MKLRCLFGLTFFPPLRFGRSTAYFLLELEGPSFPTTVSCYISLHKVKLLRGLIRTGPVPFHFTLMIDALGEPKGLPLVLLTAEGVPLSLSPPGYPNLRLIYDRSIMM